MLTNLKAYLSHTLLAVITLTTITLFSNSANAVTCTSKANADWNLDSTWDCGHVPAHKDDVVVSTAVDIQEELKIAIINNLTISATGKLTQANKLLQTISGKLLIQQYGKLTHDDNGYTSDEHIFSINFLAKDIEVQQGGVIDLLAKGYDGGVRGYDCGNGISSGCGPGGGKAGNYDGGGAGHIGVGGGLYGETTLKYGGIAYGDAEDPDTVGSGGAAATSGGTLASKYGGDGAGLARLSAAGTLTMNGAINAYGSNGTNASNQRGGGGSGGGVMLAGDTVNIGGTINANGGNGYTGSTTSSGGGGGGGAVRIVYTTAYNNEGSTITATGGSAVKAGGTGTVSAVQVETAPVLGIDTTPPVPGNTIKIIHGGLTSPYYTYVSWEPATDDSGSKVTHKIYMSKSLPGEPQAPFVELPTEQQPTPASPLMISFYNIERNFNYCFTYTAQDELGNSSKLGEAPVACKLILFDFDIKSRVYSGAIGFDWYPKTPWNIAQLSGYTFDVYLAKNPIMSYMIGGGQVSGLVESKMNLTALNYMFKTGITPNTDYYFAIKIHAYSQNYELIPNTKVTTLALPLPPANKPPSFTQYKIQTQPSQTSIQLTWSPAIDPEGDPITYQVYYSTTKFTVETRRQYTIMRSGSPTGYNIISLKPDTLYYILVTATDSKGAVSGLTDSNIRMVKTLVAATTIPPILATGFWAESVTQNTLFLKWSSASDDTTASNMITYNVYGDIGSPHQFKLIESKTSATTLYINYLEPDTEYCFFYEAIDKDGNTSNKSTPLCVVTKAYQ